MRVICLSLLIAAVHALPRADLIPFKDGHGSSRIMYGSLAAEGQFPWQILNLFTVPSMGRSLCGGSLISDSFVLTAAHCGRSDYYDFEITLGTTYSDNSDANEVVISDNEAIQHEYYDPNHLLNDVAIIRLSKSVSFTDKIQPIKMADTYIGGDVSVIVSGWGRTENSISAVRNLGYVDLKTVTNEFCQEKYVLAGNYIAEEFLCCVGSDNESTCSGDSGGPLVQQQSDGSYVHVAVVSFVGTLKCGKDYPTGFMRTASYRPWIYNQTGL